MFTEFSSFFSKSFSSFHRRTVSFVVTSEKNLSNIIKDLSVVETASKIIFEKPHIVALFNATTAVDSLVVD